MTAQHLPVVTIVDGKVTTLSTDVAEFFGKRHDNVVRAIEDIISSLPPDRLLNFEEMVVTRANPSGGAPIKAKAYRLTRDGFTFLAMGFTGPQAQGFKWAYIDAFNRMQATLSAKEVQTIANKPTMVSPAAMLNMALNGEIDLQETATVMGAAAVMLQLTATVKQIPADTPVDRLLAASQAFRETLDPQTAKAKSRKHQKWQPLTEEDRERQRHLSEVRRKAAYARWSKTHNKEGR